MAEQDQIINATMAQSIQKDAARKHPLAHLIHRMAGICWRM
jgi:hypothetical protein